MNTYILIGLFILMAYIFQIILGLRQIKNFNKNYRRLRKKGKVAIGKRPGKIRAGTIIMFAVDDNGEILDSAFMQGVTVAARFKVKRIYLGENIKSLTKEHDFVVKENKLTREAILEARKIYIQVTNGNFIEEKNVGSIELIRDQLVYKSKKIKNKIMNN